MYNFIYYFRYVLSLVISNLISTFLLLPLSVLDVLAPISTISITTYHICTSLRALTTLVSCSSILGTVCIAIDRYFAVLDPLRYHERITKPRSTVMISLVWAVATIAAFLSGIQHGFANTWNSCANETAKEETVTQMISVVSSTTFVFLIPLAVKIWIYCQIYLAAQQNIERARRSSVVSGVQDMSTQQEGFLRNMVRSPGAVGAPSILTRQGVTHLATKMKRKVSNVSTFAFNKEEGKAAKVSILVIVTFVGCWFQHFAYNVLQCFGITVPIICHQFSLLSMLSFSGISTYMYVYHRKRMLRHVKRLFKSTTHLRNHNSKRYNTNLRQYHENQKKLSITEAKSQEEFLRLTGNCETSNDRLHFPRGSLSSASASSQTSQLSSQDALERFPE